MGSENVRLALSGMHVLFGRSMAEFVLRNWGVWAGGWAGAPQPNLPFYFAQSEK